MNEEHWLCPFAQQTLLQNIEHGNQEVEDDGTSLTFSNRGHAYIATIQEWAVGPDGQNAVLKDADHQIDAVISQNQQTDFDTRHHTIQLLDFKLVLTYHPSPVKLHLHVNNCHVDQKNGTSKNKTPKKKLVKVPEIKRLMQTTQQKIQTIQASGTPKARPSTASGQSALNGLNDRSNSGGEQSRKHGLGDINGGRSEGHDIMLGDVESQTLSSQLPSGALELASQAPATRLHGANERPRQSSRSSLENVNNNSRLPDEELRNLLSRRSSKGGPVESSNSMATPKKVATEPTPNGHSSLSRRPLREIRISNRTEDGSSDEEGSVVSQSGELAGQKRVIDSSPTVRRGSQLLSKKRPRDEETDRLSQLDSQSRGPKDDPSPKKRQRTGPTSQPSAQIPESTNPIQHMANEPPVGPQNSVKSVKSPSRSQPVELDPWEGLNGITDRDVVIPKEQLDLLDAPVMSWIPPKAQDPLPQGHVPRSLLDVWNDTVQRRHRNPTLQQAIPESSDSPTKERPISPTQESDAGSDSSAELSGWDVDSSPERTRPSRTMLPPSSPVAPSGFIAKRLYSKVPVASQSLDAASSTNTKSSVLASHSSPKNKQNPLGNSTTFEPATNKGRANGSDQQPGKSSQSHEAEPNKQLFSRVQYTSAPSQEPVRRSPIPSSNPLPALGEDESDEDAMDTSVPFALGENIPDPTQSSQVEEEIRSSGASLPRVNNECVQVAVTPRIGTGQLQIEKSHGNSGEAMALNSRHDSSQAQQSSSQSRILNTFPFHASNETEDFTGSSTPGGPSQEGQIQVDVPLTQQHANNTASQSQSQGVSNQSQTDIVLDSSGPAQRHQDFSILATQSSSLEMPSSHESPLSQLRMPTQESLHEDHRPGGSANSPVVISPPRAEASTVRQSPSGSMGSDTQSQRAEPTENHTLNTQSTQLLARRQDFLKTAENTYAKARNVYRQFCSTYSPFSGDFEHFTNMCNKLRTIRQEGKLQRSFLWDDFVIMYIQEYAPYLDKQFTQDSETLSYEEYFLKTFSRPCYKKRSLTAQGIEEAASQFASQVIADQAASKIEVSPPPVVSGGATQGIVRNNYFAGSLVEQLANFGPNSINGSPSAGPQAPETQDSPRIKCEGDQLDLSVLVAPDTPAITTYNQNNTALPTQPQPQPQASSQASPGTQPQVQPQASSQASPQASLGTQPQVQPQTSPHASSQASPQASPQVSSQAFPPSSSQALPLPVPRVSSPQPALQVSPQLRVSSQASPQQSPQPVPQELPRRHSTAPSTEDVDMDEVPETDPEDAYQDEDTIHETASVELGDESFMSSSRTQPQPHAEEAQRSVEEASPAASTASDSDSESGYDGSESESENWFSSLRHIRPKGPVWSDGPTPFKRWSEAHQNLHQDRHRRGGYKILLDDKGVIRRPIYR